MQDLFIKKNIREFYTSASFNLANFFEASKDGEADCILNLLRKPTDLQRMPVKISLEECASLLGENKSNKNSQALVQCVEVIQNQIKILLKKCPEIISKINLLVKNTAEDVRKVKIEGNSSDIFNDEMTKIGRAHV